MSVQRSSVTTYATLRNWGCLARRSCRLRGGAGDAECHARGHADGANDSNRQEGGAEWQLSGGPGTAGASPTGTPSTSKSSRTHDSRSYSYPSDDVQLKTISEHDQAVYECHYGCSRPHEESAPRLLVQRIPTLRTRDPSEFEEVFTRLSRRQGNGAAVSAAWAWLAESAREGRLEQQRQRPDLVLDSGPGGGGEGEGGGSHGR